MLILLILLMLCGQPVTATYKDFADFDVFVNCGKENKLYCWTYDPNGKADENNQIKMTPWTKINVNTMGFVINVASQSKWIIRFRRPLEALNGVESKMYIYTKKTLKIDLIRRDPEWKEWNIARDLWGNTASESYGQYVLWMRDEDKSVYDYLKANGVIFEDGTTNIAFQFDNVKFFVHPLRINAAPEVMTPTIFQTYVDYRRCTGHETDCFTISNLYTPTFKPSDSSVAERVKYGIYDDVSNPGKFLMTIVFPSRFCRIKFSVGLFSYDSQGKCDTPSTVRCSTSMDFFAGYAFHKIILEKNSGSLSLYEYLRVYENRLYKLEYEQDGADYKVSDAGLNINVGGCPTNAAVLGKDDKPIEKIEEKFKYICPAGTNIMFTGYYPLSQPYAYCSYNAWMSMDHMYLAPKTESPICTTRSHYSDCNNLNKKTYLFCLKLRQDGKHFDNTESTEDAVGLILNNENSDQFDLTFTYSKAFKTLVIGDVMVNDVDSIQIGIPTEIGEVSVEKTDRGFKSPSLDLERKRLRFKSLNRKSVIDNIWKNKDQPFEININNEAKYRMPCATTSRSIKEEYEAFKPTPVGGFKFACEGPFKIFIGGDTKFVNEAICTPGGWRNPSGNFIGVSNSQPYCYLVSPPKILPLFESCRLSTKFCFPLTYSSGSYSTATRITQDDTTRMTGMTIDFQNPKAVEIKIVYPKQYTSCELSIGTKYKFNCMDVHLTQYVNIIVTIEGESVINPELHIKKYVLTSKHPVIDTLELYKEKWLIELKLINYVVKFPELDLFNCRARGGKNPGVEAIEPIRSNVNKNEYSCTVPLSEIFIDGESKGSTVYCSLSGWRNYYDTVVGDGDLKPYCYSSNPPNILPFECRNTGMFCFESDGTSVPLKTSYPTKDVVFTFSIADPKNVEIKLALPVKFKSCEFEIGTALKFDCLNPGSSFLGGGLTMAVVRGGHPHINYRKFTITSSDHVIDVLKLYKELYKVTLKLRLPNELVSPEIDLFDCSNKAEASPDLYEAFEAQKNTYYEKNKYYCTSFGPLDTIFILYASTQNKAVYCSSEGWRTEEGKIVGHKDFKPYCYSSTPPQIQPLVQRCSGKKICFESDGTKPPVKAINENAAVIFTVEFTNRNELEIRLAWPKTYTTCEFSIGTALKFDCEDGSHLTSSGVVKYEQKAGGHPTINFRKFTIKPPKLYESIIDALKLYEQKHKLSMKLNYNLQSPELSFFECPTLQAAQFKLSTRSIPAVKNVNQYECTDSILNTIHVNDKNLGVSKVWCSTDGWRKVDTHELLATTNGKVPSCYTNAKKSSLPIFQECSAKKKCFMAHGDTLKTMKTPNSNEIGIWLDTSSDQKWIIIIAHETRNKLKIGNAEWECRKNIATTSSNVKIQHEAEGQDGRVKYNKCTLTPSEKEKSIIDNLQLYMDDSNMVILRGSPDLVSEGIEFFEKCPNLAHDFKHTKIGQTKAANIEPHSNKYSCTNSRSVFLNDRFYDDQTVYCSKLGWRDSKHKLIAEFKKESVFCYILCDDHFMIKKTAVSEGAVYDVQKDGTQFSYQCNNGALAIEYEGMLYDKLTCSGNKWKFDDVVKEMSYDKNYMFTVSCFGALMFADNNCKTNEEKNNGCEELIFDNTKKDISCGTDFLLMLSDKIHNKITFEKGNWKNDKEELIEKADKTKKPTCVSHCAVEHVDVSLPQQEFVEKAQYVFDKSTKTGKITCKETDYLIISNLKTGDEGHNSPLNCLKKGWQLDKQPFLKEFDKVTSRSELKTTAYCYNVCDKKKLINQCASQKDCTEFDYSKNRLTCPIGFALFIETDASKQQIDGVLECSSQGWKVDGNMIANLDMSKSNRGKKLKVECVSKCAKRFRKLTNNQNTLTSIDTEIKCSSTHSIAYGNPLQHILSDLQCDPKTGWKDDSNNLLIDFSKNQYAVTVECKESCLASALTSTCTAQQVNCKTPDFDVNSKTFTCKDKSTVLTYKKQSHTDAIKCERKSYMSTDSVVKQLRTIPNDNIQLACISNCDDVFIDKKKCGSNDCIQDEYDISVKENRVLSCKTPSHYTKLSLGGTEMYTTDKFTCDPKKGWVSTENEKFALDFTQIQKGSSKVNIECFNICMNRIDSVCAHDSNLCVKPMGTEVVECPKSHSMEIAKFQPLIREELKCTKKGYIWKNGTRTDFTFEATPTSVKKTFKINCVSNCFLSYISKPIQNAILEKEPKRIGTNDLQCDQNQILKIENTHIFGKAECIPEKGYVNPADHTKMYIDFNKQVKFSAVCLDVCSVNLLQDLCEGTNECLKIGQTGISHVDHYRLIFDGKEVKESKIECTITGWKAGPTKTLIDFTLPETVLSSIVKVQNIHKCNDYFIANSCTEPNESTKLCSEAKRNGRKWTCPNTDEILMIEYNGVTKEAFKELECSDLGWQNEKGETLHAITGSHNTVYHVNLRCEQVCHESKLKPISCSNGEACDLENKRIYKLGERLTCGTIDDDNGLINVDSVLSVKHSGIQAQDEEQYAELTCSKEGWKNEKTGKLVIEFKPDVSRNNIAAKCVKSLCVRPHAACAQNSDVICENPDFKTVKHEATCPERFEIMLNNVHYKRLICRNGNWYSPDDQTPKLKKTDEFNMECYAGKCAQCKPLAESQISCESNRNCIKPVFMQGATKYCSHYKCPLGSSYKINNNVYLRVKTNERIEAKNIGGDSCLYEGGDVIAQTISCVNHIPCLEHTPLNTPDDLLNKLKSDFEETISNGVLKRSNCPDLSHSLYLDHKNKTFSKLKYLQCNIDGGWNMEFVDSSLTQNQLVGGERVICSLTDPSAPTVPPTTTTTTEPPPDLERACDYCPDLPTLKCDDCKTDEGALTKKTVNRHCEATSTTGRISFNNEDSDTTKPITCAMDENGKFEWKTDEGKVVLTMSARKEKLADKVSAGSIAAIILVPLLVIIAAVAAIVYVYHRRKKQAALQESMLSKGLEQKNDSVIDAISVESPKTVIF